ncbi:MAG: prepilin peptidase [Patescibacteria group bacterium]|nr:prepilin peptidase [Patescibacteria group bacterium]
MIYFLSFTIFILGLSVGSFLNVLIDRLPKGEPITGRSHCDYCKKKLTGIDLIPIVSFFILKGKSRCCHKKLSFQYPLVEIITGISYLLIFNFQFKIDNQFSIFSFQFLSLISLWGVVSCLIVIFFSDLKYRLISDYILWSFFGFSLIYKINELFLKQSFTFDEILKQIENDIISTSLIGLPIFLLYYFSKEKAMGLGDVYLAAIIGYFLGWKKGFLALYLAFLTGGIISLFLILLGRKKIKSKIAFGPFLIWGMMLAWYWEEKIFQWLSRFYGV